MKVAFYARVSSQRQEVEETIETQIMAIKDFTKLNNHTIVQEYRDDGWSGTILARPALDQLRLDASKRLWEGIVLYDPDRLSRKYAHQILVSDELESRGIKVLFVTTPPVKNEADRLLFGVKGLFAEYERSHMADRFRLGKLRKAREGHVVTSHAPYGYAYIPKQGDKHGYFEPILEEARVVRDIFQWVADEGMTIRKVIKRLQEQNIAPRKSKRGVWNNSTLATLLRNETYYGKAHFNKTVGIIPEHPKNNEKYKRIVKSSRKNKPFEDWIFIDCKPIIDKALFDRVQKQLRVNFERSVRNRKNDYLLSNLLRCTCGATRTGESPQHGKHLYYRCSRYVSDFPLPATCHQKGINARIADQMVWDEVKKLMVSPRLLKRQVERYLDRKTKVVDHENDIASIQRDLSKIAIEEERYTKAYGQQVITLVQLTSYIQEIRLKRTTLEQRLAGYAKEQRLLPFAKPTDKQIESFCQKAKDKLEMVDYQQKRRIVLSVINNIIASEKSVHIYGFLPLTEANYVKLWSEDRDITVSTRHSSLPFELKIKLPPPRKSRFIADRDQFGRIIRSFAP